jgi:hypothetical protein
MMDRRLSGDEVQRIPGSFLSLVLLGSKMDPGGRSSNGFRGRQRLDLAKQFVIVRSPAQLFDNLVGRNEVIRQTF